MAALFRPRLTAQRRPVAMGLDSDTFTDGRRRWRWVVDVQPALPTPTDLLTNCRDFLVDDDCDRTIGVVEDVITYLHRPVAAWLLVVTGWGRHRIMLPVDEVIAIAPAERRLVICCRAGHRLEQTEQTRLRAAISRLLAPLRRRTHPPGRGDP
jgi:hypothetical protein